MEKLKKKQKVRQKLANPFYGKDYIKRLNDANCVDLEDNYIQIKINESYSRIVPISNEKKVNIQSNLENNKKDEV